MRDLRTVPAAEVDLTPKDLEDFAEQSGCRIGPNASRPRAREYGDRRGREGRLSEQSIRRGDALLAGPGVGTGVPGPAALTRTGSPGDPWASRRTHMAF